MCKLINDVACWEVELRVYVNPSQAEFLSNGIRLKQNVLKTEPIQERIHPKENLQAEEPF
jgi:hypothetical protein